MVNTKTRLIILFAIEDGEAQYGEHKQNLGLDCGSRWLALYYKAQAWIEEGREKY